MANPNIFMQAMRPLRSVADYSAQLDEADLNKSRNALAALTMQASQRKMAADEAAAASDAARRNKLAALFQASAGDESKLISGAKADPDLYGWGVEQEGAALERKGKSATASKAAAEAAEKEAELASKRRTQQIQQMATAQSPQQAVEMLNTLDAIPMNERTQLIRAMSQVDDPQKFMQLKGLIVLGLATPEQQATGMLPKRMSAGGQIVDVNPLSGAAPIAVTQTPDSRAADARARELLNLSRERLNWEKGGGADMGTDPSQSLLTKRFGKPPAGYRWTAAGDQERIPGGPADAKAQAADEAKAGGAAQVNEAVASLRDAYDRLESGGGITSTKKGAIENLVAAAGSSGPGQAVGRALGTQNQSARNDIAMARPALLAALMKATGMSAKQMDSNVELKLWLSTATDPTLDVEANRKALDAIERKYLDPLRSGDGGVKRINSDAEYDKLPSGATFIAPDGTTRRKP